MASKEVVDRFLAELTIQFPHQFTVAPGNATFSIWFRELTPFSDIQALNGYRQYLRSAELAKKGFPTLAGVLYHTVEYVISQMPDAADAWAEIIQKAPHALRPSFLSHDVIKSRPDLVAALTWSHPLVPYAMEQFGGARLFCNSRPTDAVKMRQDFNWFYADCQKKFLKLSEKPEAPPLYVTELVALGPARSESKQLAAPGKGGERAPHSSQPSKVDFAILRRKLGMPDPAEKIEAPEIEPVKLSFDQRVARVRQAVTDGHLTQAQGDQAIEDMEIYEKGKQERLKQSGNHTSVGR